MELHARRFLSVRIAQAPEGCLACSVLCIVHSCHPSCHLVISLLPRDADRHSSNPPAQIPQDPSSNVGSIATCESRSVT